MNKTELVRHIRTEAGLTKAQSAAALNAALEGIASALGEADTVVLPGFGNFVVRDRAEYVGRHPQTGEPLKIPAKRNVVFKAGKALREGVN